MALATYFYIFSGDATRFLPAAACAGHQLQVPASDFPLICTLSSTPVQRNQSSIVNALKHEPHNGPTRILTAAVWLKLSRKYFNEGTAKEACERFLVRVKQLSRVLTGRKYLGGTQARKRKTTDEPPAKHKKTNS